MTLFLITPILSLVTACVLLNSGKSNDDDLIQSRSFPVTELLTLDRLCLTPNDMRQIYSLMPLTPIWMVSGLFQLVFLFIFRYAMSWHVDDFDSITLTLFNSNMGVCSQPVYSGAAPQTKT